jgi:hypothetical protein
MTKHRNPRQSLAKRASHDNFSAEINDLIYLLRDNLGKADAFITAAEREIEESWRTDEDPAAEDDTGDSVLRRRSRIEHLVEAGKLAVRAAAYTTEEIDVQIAKHGGAA